MTLRRSVVSALAVMMAITLFAPRIVRAAGTGTKIIVRFNKPVEIPNLVLEPGTYVFRLANHAVSRDIVHVFNEGETRVFATLFTIPKYRATVSDQPVFQLEE